ncbi:MULTISPECIES: ABC transporter ATP-binding protein [Paenibacillus]|uniref:ABC transporter ATP-binding protein n=1 Tax=Paenibacillus TaxID=44249 RepID=UPI0022B874B2|nr:ABC transporter ATP-binding protein [Paenibacillus caseinilyticus]MCZ8520300.1 ABC transporter ATP-binding protein [Paenibacillus caseinilyticus]
MSWVLRTNGLTKRYANRQKPAVEDVSLEVAPGEIYGFLGQNGAGKTTTLRMIMGLVLPTSGEVELFGRRLTGGGEGFARIGFLPEVPGHYPQLTAAEHLRLHSRLTGYAGPERTEETLRLLGLGEVRDVRAGRLSLGLRQRLGLARAIAHGPELLVLDEPTNGVDPAGLHQLRQLLLDLAKQRGMAVLLSSHLLGEVQQIADRIGIMHDGRLLEQRDAADLQRTLRSCIELRVEPLEQALVILEQKLGMIDYELRDNRTVRVYGKSGQSAEIARVLVMEGMELMELKVRHDSLEDYYLRLIGGQGA